MDPNNDALIIATFLNPNYKNLSFLKPCEGLLINIENSKTACHNLVKEAMKQASSKGKLLESALVRIDLAEDLVAPNDDNGAQASPLCAIAARFTEIKSNNTDKDKSFPIAQQFEVGIKTIHYTQACYNRIIYVLFYDYLTREARGMSQLTKNFSVTSICQSVAYQLEICLNSGSLSRPTYLDCPKLVSFI